MLKRWVRLGAGMLAKALEPTLPRSPNDLPGAAPFDSPANRDGETHADLRVRELEAENADLRAEVATLGRKAGEYFKLIEGVLGERDQWKKMWFDDSAGHQEAQALLEGTIKKGRQYYQRALVELNALRAEKNQQPLNWDLEPVGGPPEGTAAATLKRNTELEANAPKGIDAVAERDRIAGGESASTKGMDPR